MSEEEINVTIGTTVYDENGKALGEVRGITDGGFVISTGDGVEALSIEHERAGHEYGEAELLWRCADCGELGEVEDIPDECPSCGADKTALYYCIED
ncbi:rubredoxin-like domain-containing protein [Halolamina sp.]|jgi:rubredoxin|uniref:DUF7130 family rubredoxin-like protein n=1 Tax=Halolamina sp. TaxID=1940283 RepID=UPI000223BB4D|nr:small CPxCG-related zinc finger protein [halophilic archaeon DL31]